MVQLRRFSSPPCCTTPEQALAATPPPTRRRQRSPGASAHRVCRERAGRLVVLALATLAVGLAPFGSATGIGYAAGTVIETSAAALNYENVNGAQQPTVLSNIVRILVTQPAAVPDVQVTPSNANGHGGSGQTLYYTVTIANKGDGSDSFKLALSSIAGWPARMLDDDGAGDGIVGDGIHQPYESSIIYETGALSPGETFSCFCAVGIPADAQEGDGDFTVLTVSSVSSPAVQTSAAFTTEVTLAPLTGQVTDRVSGHPLSGAVVNVYQDDVWVDTTVTLAPYGIYEFGRELLPGVYRVSATYPGYAQQMRWDITVTDASTTYINFFLDFGYPQPGLSRLGGQVLDAVTQRAIVGASVLAYMNGWLVAQTTTGAQGLYDILDLPPGAYVVQVVADGYVTNGHSNVQLVADQATLLDCYMSPM